MERVGHIYAIKNKTNGMYYVGQTRRAKVETRWAEHRHSSKFFSEYLREIGEENFEFIHLETVPIDLLNTHERGWVELLNALHPGGYNKIVGGHGHTITAQSTREKMSRSSKGKPHSPEHAAAIAAALKGRTYAQTEAQKAAMARLQDARRGRPVSATHLTAIQAAGARRRGRKLTAEQRAKISAGQLGRKASDDTRAKMSAAHKKRVPTNSPESYARGWAKRRQRKEQGVFA